MARLIALFTAVSLCLSLFAGRVDAAPHGGCLSYRDMPVCTPLGEASAPTKLKSGKCFDVYLADQAEICPAVDGVLPFPVVATSLSRFQPDVPRRPPRG
ncbi:hypothetical protein CDV50_15790 [Haematobacter massiliensis]|uniref:Uncharacterized protein n=2 Tax=Haematobacter massiliensis TaxID=195105 RepID=A0A086Y588_9RHOB|nr:hypothetical protein [Haematobacter massiliensis]KFI29438.1 hypothetical protein CN97_16525 [Haematobacter massiliensis]OWJ69917.1 hypothetical protein CDV50_15790 [Haematobacter massiliensis]OWJ82661.1 hypothetical protein CDV51_17255 [Haematobacter massiliensis]